MSLGNAPFKLPYLLAHTSYWEVLEHFRIQTPWATQCSWPYPRSWFLISVGGRCSQHPGPSLTLGSLGPSHPWCHKSRVSLLGPPCAHHVASIPHEEVCDMYWPNNNSRIQRFSQLDIPTIYSYLTCMTILIPIGRFFETIVDVDQWYCASTYIPIQHWLKPKSTYNFMYWNIFLDHMC